MLPLPMLLVKIAPRANPLHLVLHLVPAILPAIALIVK